MFKRFICFILSAFLVFSLVGCSRNENQLKTKAFDSKHSPTEPNEAVVAENDLYTLSYDKTTKGIKVTEKLTGNTWGTSPNEPSEVKYDEWGDPVTRHPQVDSVLLVEYMSAETGNTDLVISKNGAVKNGRVNFVKIKNGIRAEYYFDEVGFMIPVDYTLRDDSVLLTIDPKEIQESENTIVNISVAPFWCAAENDKDNSYLFVPSGSGAIIYPRSESQQGTKYSAQVYGNDPSIEAWDVPTTDKAVRLECFGAKAGNLATIGIIESGAESAQINVNYGSKAVGYSSVYASFILRGNTNNIADLMPGERVKNLIYADNMIETPLSIGFYPLTGELGDYSGMAKVYREYLADNAQMDNKGKESPVNLEIIGSTMISKSFLGVPYETLFAATTIEEAGEIIKKLEAEKIYPTVKFTGFGQSGITVGKLAGGFKIASKLGGKKDINSLAEYCKKRNIDTYIDFDLINFSSGAGGFSAFFDSALCASRKIAYQYDFDIAVRGRNEESRYRLLSRDSLIGCAEKLFDKTSYLKTSGYALSSVSNTAYSDYSDRSSVYSYSKANMSKDVAEIFSKTDKKLLVSDANAYAAARADIIFDAPTSSAQSDIFDEDIPFYQMVFKGEIPIATEGVNISANPEKIVLKAVEGGCGLTYTVIGNYSQALLDIKSKYFYNSLFSDICDDIISDTKHLSEYYEKIDGAHIIHHEILGGGLRRTVYDNGVTVYVNYSDSVAVTDFGDVPSGGYLIGGDGNAKK